MTGRLSLVPTFPAAPRRGEGPLMRSPLPPQPTHRAAEASCSKPADAGADEELAG